MNYHAKLLNAPDNYPAMTELVNQWHSLKVSSAYVLADQIRSQETIRALSEFHGDLWLIIQTFLEPAQCQFPLAVTETGEDAIGKGDGEWLRMLCPRGKNREGTTLLQWRSSQIEQLVRDFSPAGISLDFIRHFVFWEGVHTSEDIGKTHQSCFCSRCIHQFSEEFSLPIPDELSETAEISQWILDNHRAKWREFTAETITSSVKYLSEQLKSQFPKVKLNLHLVPWSSEEYEGAIRNIAGQDITALEPYIDQVAPMCYAPMLKRPAAWITQYLNELKSCTKLPIYPALQICPMYGTAPLSDSEFQEMINSAKEGDGVMIWPWERLTESQLKTLETTGEIPDS